MSYPYYALVKNEHNEFSFLPTAYEIDTEGRIIGDYQSEVDALEVEFVSWAIDLQDVAVAILRANGHKGLGGRLKKTGVLLCTWSGMPDGDYLRIALNGVVCNPDLYPEQDELVRETFRSLRETDRKTMEALSY